MVHGMFRNTVQGAGSDDALEGSAWGREKQNGYPLRVRGSWYHGRKEGYVSLPLQK
jgi:hypothetical protein